MTFARQMILTHPDPLDIDADVVSRCIDENLSCAQACTACADACVAEESVAHLRRCIRLCLNCADICEATGRIISRTAPLDDNYVPARSQATPSVLAFFAQDHASTEMVYPDVTKRAAARPVVAFADQRKTTTESDPGLVVFDSKLTTYATLEELSARASTG